MNTPLFRPEDLAVEKEYVLKKLGYSEAEWARIMQTPAIPHEMLPNNSWMFNTDNPLVQFIRRTAKREEKR